MKTCSKCKENLPAESFASDRSRSDGLAIYCNVCRRRMAVERYRSKGSTPSARTRAHLKFAPKQCITCGKEYVPTGPGQKYCSRACYHPHLELVACENCGREVRQYKPSKKKLGPRRFCSRPCHKAFHAHQIGRRYVKDGYAWVKVPKGTPGADRTSRMPEHRYVMQESLGRPILRSETVHHINWDTLDNRLENLELRQGKHGNGVRMVCLDCGSHNVGPAPLTATCTIT